MPRHIFIKLSKIKYKEKILKAANHAVKKKKDSRKEDYYLNLNIKPFN